MVAQSLKAPHQRIAREFRGLVNDLISYHAAFKSCHSKAIADMMEELRGLDCLDPEDIKRISPTINDAARCHHSTNWRPLFSEAIRGRRRMKAAIAAAIITFLLFCRYSLPEPHAANINFTEFLFSIVIAEFLWIIGSIVQSLVPYRYRTALLMVLVSAASLAVAEFQRWSSSVLPIWKGQVSSFTLVNLQTRHQVAAAPVAEVIDLALWFVAFIGIVTVVYRFVSFCAKAGVSRLEFGYGRPAEQCAELIIAFLQISSFITTLVGRMQGIVTDDEDFVWIEASKLPSNYARERISDDLDELADLVRKSWREAMRSRNGAAGIWISDQARRIEFFVRLHRAKNMLAGNNLVELRDSMACALIQAADGNWHLIGSEMAEYSNAVLSGRRKMMIRRSIAIVLPIFGAVAATHYLRAPYVQAVVLTCLGFAGVQLLGLIDPDSPARLDIAGRVAGVLKRGNG